MFFVENQEKVSQNWCSANILVNSEDAKQSVNLFSLARASVQCQYIPQSSYVV